ncbi:MAG: ABC transporter permease [Fastidiosipilaceae bacterium]|jgi:osmoprotectant transport system permease protein
MTWQMIFDHLFVVLISAIITIILGVALGIISYRYRRLGKVILWIVELLQTIPALALLGLILLVMGAGKGVTITGLVLYSLLPVVQNTNLGLTEVDEGVKDAAIGMGMTGTQRLRLIELPLATPLIFTGIRISVVNAIGVAVFGAFVGGGGLGNILYQGIRVQNAKLILQGTLALMAMAVVFDWGLSALQKKLEQSVSPAQSDEISDASNGNHKQ